MLNYLMNITNGLEERDLYVPFTKNDINELGIIIIKSYDLLGMSGLNIAGLFRPFIEDINKDIPMIVIDGEFEELTESTQQFVLLHEIGHINYHLDKAEIEKTRDINDEFEADEYAVKIIGKENSIKALEELKEMMDGFDERCINELDMRIQFILNN